MTPLPRIDLRQIHADTLRAISENERKYEDQRKRILELLADALREVRFDAKATEYDVARKAGVHVHKVMACEACVELPTNAIIQAYIAIAEERETIPMPAPAKPCHEGESIHFATVTHTSGHGINTVGSACGKGVLLGGANEVTCERCKQTQAFEQIHSAINQSRKP